MLSFDVSFDIMRKSTIIFLLYFQIHIFGAQKSLHDETVLLSTKIHLKVIENTILHNTRPSVRSSVRTILLFVFVIRSNISTLRI